MEKEELEVIDPNTKYEVDTRLLPRKVTFEAVKETNGCEGCFFEKVDCKGMFKCDGIIFKPVFDKE